MTHDFSKMSGYNAIEKKEYLESETAGLVVKLSGTCPDEMAQGDTVFINKNHPLFVIETVEKRDHRGIFKNPETRKNLWFQAVCRSVISPSEPVKEKKKIGLV